MDLTKVLVELRRELEILNAAILTLERIQSRSARRGRPPKLLADLRKSYRTTSKRLDLARRAISGERRR